VGVAANEADEAFAELMDKGAKGGILPELPLNEESKFCAEDFLRIVGRCTGPSGCVPM
jgi:hypothetical protein